MEFSTALYPECGDAQTAGCDGGSFPVEVGTCSRSDPRVSPVTPLPDQPNRSPQYQGHFGSAGSERLLLHEKGNRVKASGKNLFQGALELADRAGRVNVDEGGRT